ncbi:MAG: hypothetical protein ABI355_13070 [Solirubrobacteraceae bacterium]
MHIRVALLVAVLAFATGAPGARASYPGRAGAIVYDDANSSFDPLNNGATAYTESLSALSPGAAAQSVLRCQGSDVGFLNGPQYCPASAPGFSPGGTTLVVSGTEYQPDGTAGPDPSDCSYSDACPKGLILADANGSNPRLLPAGVLDAEHPAFLPDGKHVVFAGSMILHGVRDLYTVATDGSDLTQLTTNGADDPAPCPNGALLYTHRGDVYRRAAGGRRTVRLTSQGGASFPDCAHDSRAIAFVRHATLYTATINGTHLRRLGTAGVVSGHPAYSPAGGAIAIATDRRCTSHCGGHFPQCTNITVRIEVLDLAGRRRAASVAGRNYCSSDGDLGGDVIEGIGWQPLSRVGR